MAQEEEWERVSYPGFDNYMVSDAGNIQSRRMRKNLKFSQNQYGVVWVGLWDREWNRQRTVVVSKVVADHFVQGKSGEFNTPVNLDGDRWHNQADNLIWRPRWFAVKYLRQFEEAILWPDKVRDDETQEVYQDSRDLATHQGLLEMDVVVSITNGSHIFPTWHSYSRV